MNLYKLHSNPEQLIHYDQINNLPFYVWGKLNEVGSREYFQNNREHIENVASKDAELAYNYAKLIGERFPAGEDVILSDPEYAAGYAGQVLENRWPEAEAIIATKPRYAVQYAQRFKEMFRHGRFIEAEPNILKSAVYSYQYATRVLRHEWPEAEPVIMKEPNTAYDYAYVFKDANWPEAEKYIKQDNIAWRAYLSSGHHMR